MRKCQCYTLLCLAFLWDHLFPPTMQWRKGTSNSVWALNFLHLRVNSKQAPATHPSNSHVGETLVSVWGQPELRSEHEFYDHLVWTMVWHLVTKKLSTLMSLIFFLLHFSKLSIDYWIRKRNLQSFLVSNLISFHTRWSDVLRKLFKSNAKAN